MKKTNFKLYLSSFIAMCIVCTVVFTAVSKLQAIELSPANNDENFYLPTYDVIVVGTDPEGISAAISSARNGLKTLLIDTRNKVGGLFTLGGLNSLDMNYYEPNGSRYSVLLTQGIFLEFLKDTGSWKSLINGKYSRDSFDVVEAEAIFNKMIAAESNITLQLGVDYIEPILEDNNIVGIEVFKQDKIYYVYSEVCIDATQDADLAAACGVPFTVGAETLNMPEQMQAITQVFKVENIDWNLLEKEVKAHEDYYQAWVNNYSVWGFWPQLQQYKPLSSNVKVRGPNIGRQNDDSALINAIQIIGYDPLNIDHIAQIKEIAFHEVQNIVEYMRGTIPGFAKATFAGVTEELYIRESRHIEGEYTLSIVDVMQNVDFDDKIAWGSYPVDIQSSDMSNMGYVLGAPDAYSIPFRCIVPQTIDNLLVVGRSASYDPLAFGSARVVPIGMAVAEAAGVAAAYAVENDMTFREIAYDEVAIKSIQSTLRKQGAYLEDLNLSYEYKGLVSEPAINFFYSIGFLSSGYDNYLGFDEIAKEITFYNALINIDMRTQVDFPFKNYVYKSIDTPIPTRDVVNVLWQVLGNDTLIQFEDKVATMRSEGVVSERMMDILLENQHVTKEILYIILYEFYLYNLQFV
ncbi:MAG: hypothetical protein ATN33_07760 [Epulopiscium sp. Nele67-Bin001]|nr:MAG: hypothetical protein ATN33_07760 [Epulopiscium sp. Nele67-Bin001]